MILDDPANDGNLPAHQQANAKTREVAGRAGVTTQIVKIVGETAKAPAKSRTPGLLAEGIELLTVLAPPEGDLDAKAGDVIMATAKSATSDAKVVLLGL
eukprot:3043556-Prymnesium_polylepis.1